MIALLAIFSVSTVSFGCSRADYTPEQAAMVSELRADNLKQAQQILVLTHDVEQARKDFKAGTLTPEQFNDLTARLQSNLAGVQERIVANQTKWDDLRKQGIPLPQSIWDSLGPVIIALGGSALLDQLQKRGTVKTALAKVEEIRGPADKVAKFRAMADRAAKVG